MKKVSLPQQMNPVKAKLAIRLKRNADGSAALTCMRADGSTTWQRQTGTLGQFFPGHDLTHYAVETVLDSGDGFFGLIAVGWEITDFAPPFARGPIPPEARAIELLVSLIDNARSSGTAQELRAQGQLHAASRRSVGKEPEEAPSLNDLQLERIRSLRGKLLERWAATGSGQSLELTFAGPPPG